MSFTGGRRLLETREEAVTIVQKLLTNEKCSFCLVNFETYNKVARLRSKHYHHYYVLCHENTTQSAGWLVCRYVRHGSCQIDKSVFSFRTIQGGTLKLERHTKLHTTRRENSSCFVRALPRAAKTSVDHGAALAVALDLRPLSFCDGHRGMTMFAKALFELGKTVPVHESVNPKSYLPGKTAVTASVKELAHSLRENFKRKMVAGCIANGGAVSVDGVHLKANGKHYYDFTVHIMKIADKKGAQHTEFEVENKSLLLVEGPEVATATNIREQIEMGLLQKYQTSLDHFLRNFTMVNDRAAVMAKVAHASVSAELHAPDESWLGCMVHFLNNVMKHTIAGCGRDSILQVVSSDFKSMKRIVEDANRGGWNQYLPDGHTLVQDVETRFGTHFRVAQRFLKSSKHIQMILESKNRPHASAAFQSMKKKTDADGNIIGFPAVEAICDAFGIIMEVLDRFEASSRPTMHIALPLLYKSMKQLDLVGSGGEVWRESELEMVQPSIYSKILCRQLVQYLRMSLKPHPLLLVGCYLNPLFRSMEFVPEITTRRNMRMKAEEFTRKLARPHLINVPHPHSLFGDGTIDIDGLSRSSSENGPNQQTQQQTLCGQKRSFSLIDFADSEPTPRTDNDEISIYNDMNLTNIKQMGTAFIDDDFSVIKFWNDRKRHHPAMFAVACRVMATPVSSSASERVFSVLKQLVSDNRSRLLSETIEDIVVIRSLYEK